MPQSFEIRRATPLDGEVVGRVLSASFGTLLSGHYPVAVLAGAVPAMSAAQPGLLSSGRYFIAFAGDVPAAVGGWSHEAPGPGGGIEPGLGHVRHVASHPDQIRRGAARAIMERVLEDALAGGCNEIDCLSTLNAVPFYAMLGFRVLGEEAIDFGGGVSFPAVRMRR